MKVELEQSRKKERRKKKKAEKGPNCLSVKDGEDKT